SVFLLLTVIAVGASVMNWQLHRHVRRAEEAEDKANLRLYDSLVDQARATRRSGKAGQRFDSLRALSEAARLAQELGLGDDSAMQLRNEVIASLALTDVRVSQELSLEPSTRAGSWIACDPQLNHFAYPNSRGDMIVSRLSDGVEVARLPAQGRTLYGMRFSPDGQWLAILAYKLPENLKIHLLLWRWQHGMECQQLPFLVADRAFDFMPDST